MRSRPRLHRRRAGVADAIAGADLAGDAPHGRRSVRAVLAWSRRSLRTSASAAALSVWRPRCPLAGGPPPIVLTAWTARELDASPAIPSSSSTTAEDRRRNARHRAGDISRRRHRADGRPGRRSPAGARLPRHHELRQFRRLGSAVSDRSEAASGQRTRPTGRRTARRRRRSCRWPVGQRLWQTRYGRITSLRLHPSSNATASSAGAEDRLAALRHQIVGGVDPVRAGLTVIDVPSQNLAASAGATDFGAYFSYFSFFLMVSALLLAALFFRLSIEQRRSEIGVLRATGFAIAYRAAAVLDRGRCCHGRRRRGRCAARGRLGGADDYGLRTWWVGAVGTTLLRVHVDWLCSRLAPPRPPRGARVDRPDRAPLGPPVAA